MGHRVRARVNPVLPSRDGLSPSCVSLPPGPWLTVMDFVLARFARIPRNEWERRFAQREVLGEDGSPLDAETLFRPHTRLYYYRTVAQEIQIPFEEDVLFQDGHIVVADKPHFLAVAPTGRYVQETLLVRLKRRLGLPCLQPIHRIDRETAGLVMFCVQPHERDAYHALFRQHRITKSYEAIAPWRDDLIFPTTRHTRLVPGEPFFRTQEVAGEPNALTHLELLERRGDQARYRLWPKTGQHHQLRVHMAALGLPIKNDAFYPNVRQGPTDPDDWSAPLQLLAKSVAFIDPVTGQSHYFESPLQLTL